jgi:hypothetical protein
MANTAEIKIRLSPDEKAAWDVAAKEAGLSTSEFVRQAVNVAASNKAVAFVGALELASAGTPGEAAAPQTPTPQTPRRCSHGRRGWCPVCDK